MSLERHDAMFMDILQEKKTILGFLQSVFGFLSRRTDFYHEMKTPDDKMGFPPGYKDQIILQVVKQFEKKFDNSYESIPPAVNEIEVVSEEVISTENVHTEECPAMEDSSPVCKSKNSFNKTPLGVFNPSSSKEIQKFQANEYYNGAKFDNYCWSQTINDLEIHIQLTEDITSSKDLKITLESSSIKILNKKSDQIVMEGVLFGKCKHNDAVWSLSEKKLQINLDKIKSQWWHKLLLSENSIDLTQMDCSRSLHEMPEEEQAIIEKLKWDQHQKMLGLPTSTDIKNNEILKVAWNAEGSPFKGQPFNPSIIKFE